MSDDRIATALNRIANTLEKIAAGPIAMGGLHKLAEGFANPADDFTRSAADVFAKPGNAFQTRPEFNAEMLLLANKLLTWVDENSAVTLFGYDVLRDAISQATAPATVHWLAAIAERYGFKP